MRWDCDLNTAFGIVSAPLRVLMSNSLPTSVCCGSYAAGPGVCCMPVATEDPVSLMPWFIVGIASPLLSAGMTSVLLLLTPKPPSPVCISLLMVESAAVRRAMVRYTGSYAPGSHMCATKPISGGSGRLVFDTKTAFCIVSAPLRTLMSASKPFSSTCGV